VAASAQTVADFVPAAQGSEPSAVAAPSTGGLEPGSTPTAQASVEVAEVEATVRDAGRADAEREVVEVSPEVGQTATQLGEVQP
jgi:hypothetical protein